MATDATTEVSTDRPTRAEERRLFEQYAANKSDDNRNAIVERYLFVVDHHAWKVFNNTPGSVEHGDLVAVGTMGLIDAIKTFDLARGFRFTTYCAPRVRGAMLDELRAVDWVPRLTRSRQNQYVRAVDHLMQELGRRPEDSELVDHLGVDVEALARVISSVQAAAVASLDHPVGETDGGAEVRRCDLIEGADRRTPPPEHAAIEKDQWELILRGCSDRERKVIYAYYRLGWTMKKTAEFVGLSESRVSQLLSTLLPRLRARLKDRADEFV